MGVLAVGVTVVWLLVLCAYDIRQRRLPNWLTLPGGTVILAAATCFGHGAAAVAGAAALVVVYLLVHLVAPAALGGGDVKLAVGVGALTGVFGPDVWLLAALGAPLLTAAFACAAAIRGIPTVPHGPSMCMASAAAIGLVLA
ncbi:A24 family peptidase [Mycolicibacterium brisbanense]|uniref:Peptidase A24A, prepilin type IV n=1 Tax=Mycolicibacterium brisbanense TaxID=146020 RepID=A0A100W5M4_9MYCO|nr:A24 family peptidase [Mycolicibacterium brisbanense]MCV7162521.1 prepilin peptidase [Mycolicibacterium brisbanense]GAS92068.1 peptidase A24A, prepilin type IV [Mycolicibacterium brisbanense]